MLSARPAGLAAGAAGVAFAVALNPVTDRAAADSLSVHMVQHLLLVLVAAPLAALALPALRPPAGRWAPFAVAAVTLHVVALFGWHAPLLYDTAQRVLPVHAAEHGTFVVAGMALWVAVLPRRGEPPVGLGVLAVFVAAVACTLLGAAMTTAGDPWYDSYAGPDALADQQLAGAVMWAFGGLGYLAIGVGVFATWVLRSGPRSPISDAAPAAVGASRSATSATSAR